MMLWIILGFLVGFLEKMDEISKIWAISGVLHLSVGIPGNSVGPRHDMVEREVWKASGTPRRSYCSQHGNFWCFVMFFYFVILRTCLLD